MGSIGVQAPFFVFLKPWKIEMCWFCLSEHIPLDVGYVDGYGLLVTLVKNTICAHKSVIVIVYSTSYWFV